MPLTTSSEVRRDAVAVAASGFIAMSRTALATIAASVNTPRRGYAASAITSPSALSTTSGVSKTRIVGSLP